MSNSKLSVIVILISSICVIGSVLAYPPSGYDYISTTAHIDFYHPQDSSMFLEGMDMTGRAVIWRGDEYDTGNCIMAIDTRMDTLILRGYSTLFGDSVFITLDRESPPSDGMITQVTPGIDFPAESFFDVYYKVTIGSSPDLLKFEATYQGGFSYDINNKVGVANLDKTILDGFTAELKEISDEVIPSTPTNKDYFCENIYYYDDTATSTFVFDMPNSNGTDMFQTRFTVTGASECTLKIAWILMYGSFMVGTPDMMVYLWDDDGFGLPGTLLDSVLVPYAALPISGFGWAFADFSAGNWVFSEGEDYHYGWSVIGGSGDILWGVTDKGTGPHNGEARSGMFYQGAHYSILDLYGEDYVFFMESEVCCVTSGYYPLYPPHMTSLIYQIPPYGRVYQDPRKIPIIDPNNGETIAWIWHKHEVDLPDPGVDDVPTIGTMALVIGPVPPQPGQLPDEVIELVGNTIISRSQVYYNPYEKREIQTEIIEMNLVGESQLFGLAILSLPFPAPGLATAIGSDEFFPAESFFDVYYEIEFPWIGQTMTPSLSASPPPHMVAEIEALPPYNRQFIDPVYHPIEDISMPGIIIGWVLPIHWVQPAPEPDPCDCCIKRGDALHDNQLVLVNDLVYLVNYVFKGGPPPPCLEEGDVVLPLDDLILVNDLVYLVNFVFKSGPPPPPC